MGNSSDGGAGKAISTVGGAILGGFTGMLNGGPVGGVVGVFVGGAAGAAGDDVTTAVTKFLKS